MWSSIVTLPNFVPVREPLSRCGALVIDSMPPATTTLAEPALIRVVREHHGLHARAADLVDGQGAGGGGDLRAMAAWRAGAWPRPAGSTQPMMTSSTWSGARPAWSRAPAMRWRRGSGGDAGELAQQGADGGALGTDDDDVGHGGCCLGGSRPARWCRDAADSRARCCTAANMRGMGEAALRKQSVGGFRRGDSKRRGAGPLAPTELRAYLPPRDLHRVTPNRKRSDRSRPQRVGIGAALLGEAWANRRAVRAGGNSPVEGSGGPHVRRPSLATEIGSPPIHGPLPRFPLAAEPPHRYLHAPPLRRRQSRASYPLAVIPAKAGEPERSSAIPAYAGMKEARGHDRASMHFDGGCNDFGWA
jgi:hypothetical protein